ncbi:hypothetical protein ACMFY2_13000 [Enterobacter cloacae subsp. cloacae]
MPQPHATKLRCQHALPDVRVKHVSPAVAHEPRLDHEHQERRQQTDQRRNLLLHLKTTGHQTVQRRRREPDAIQRITKNQHQRAEMDKAQPHVDEGQHIISR